MIKTIFFILCILVGLNINAQNFDSKLEVSFQEDFKGDEVSLSIGRCILFKNKILISREIGFAGIIVSFHEHNTISIDENGANILEKKCCFNLNKTIKFNLIINGKNEIIRVNLKDGKYIGLNKEKEKNKFKIRQLKIPFEYE